jgi:hypothetical protein
LRTLDFCSDSCIFVLTAKKATAMAPLSPWLFKNPTAAAPRRDDYLGKRPLLRRHRHGGSGAAAVVVAVAPPWTSLLGIQTLPFQENIYAQ